MLTEFSVHLVSAASAGNVVRWALILNLHLCCLLREWCLVKGNSPFVLTCLFPRSPCHRLSSCAPPARWLISQPSSMNHPSQQYVNYSIRPLSGYWVTTRQFALPYCFMYCSLHLLWTRSLRIRSEVALWVPGGTRLPVLYLLWQTIPPLCDRTSESAVELAELWHWYGYVASRHGGSRSLGGQAFSYKALALWRLLCNHRAEGRTISFNSPPHRSRGYLQKWGFKVLDCAEFPFSGIPIFSFSMFLPPYLPLTLAWIC